MTYTLTSAKWKEPIIVRSTDGVVIASPLSWMFLKPVTDIVAWCKKYHIKWTVTL